MGFSDCSRRESGRACSGSESPDPAPGGAEPIHSSRQLPDRIHGTRRALALQAPDRFLVWVGQQFQELVGENEADHRSHDDRRQGFEDAPAQLLEVAQKGHFLAIFLPGFVQKVLQSLDTYSLAAAARDSVLEPLPAPPRAHPARPPRAPWGTG